MRLPFRSSRRLASAIALACAVVLTSAAVAASAAAASPAAPGGTPRCQTSGLVIWLTIDGAAAGSAFYTLNFTNLSGHACTLRGHPGVSTASLSNRKLGSPASWQRGRTRTVRLANDATAYALVQYSDVITGDGGSRPCHPVVAAGLRVYPPGQTTSKTAPIPLTACTTHGLVFMRVRPVQKNPPPR